MSYKAIHTAFILGAFAALSTGCGAAGDTQASNSEGSVASEQAINSDGSMNYLVGDRTSSLDFTYCSAEYGSCVAGKGGRYVAFGANGKYVYKYFSAGTFSCTLASFNNVDPISGVVKACSYANVGNMVAANATGYAYNKVVAYGANGVFHFRTINGSYTCNDATFNGSPISGTKACYEALPDYEYYAAENGSFSLGTASYPVAYGANGSYVFKKMTGNVNCNNATFGDPASGIGKACYILGAWYVADENGSFNLNGYGYSFCDIYYLSDRIGNAVMKSTFSGTCNNTTFGDPDPGYPKRCYAYCQTIY